MQTGTDARPISADVHAADATASASATYSATVPAATESIVATANTAETVNG